MGRCCVFLGFFVVFLNSGDYLRFPDATICQLGRMCFSRVVAVEKGDEGLLGCM